MPLPLCSDTQVKANSCSWGDTLPLPVPDTALLHGLCPWPLPHGFWTHLCEKVGTLKDTWGPWAEYSREEVYPTSPGL